MDTMQRELERRVFYLSALNELGKELGPLQDIEAICNAALSVTMGTVGAMRGLVLLGDRDTSQLQVCVVRGIGVGETPLVPVEELVSTSEVQTVLQMEGALATLLKDIQMVVWAPLHVDARLIGGLGFGPKMSGEGFTDEDQSLLSTMRMNHKHGSQPSNKTCKLSLVVPN